MPSAATRPDTVCADAVSLARSAAVEAAPTADSVGDHLGVTSEGDRLVTHAFACADLAYRGWHWSVTVARAARSKAVTVSEVTLLPGDGAVVSPPWVPWGDRVRPGDLGPGVLLPTSPDDARLEPGYVETGEDADPLTWWEPGLGRARVLSLEGRQEAAERWYAGEHGPDAPIARAAPGTCATCGFLVPMSGSLRLAFGTCANALVPDDGTVVSLDHGCGGHSEAAVRYERPPQDPAPAIDEVGFDELDLPRPEQAAAGGEVEVIEGRATTGTAGTDGRGAPDAGDESLGHS